MAGIRRKAKGKVEKENVCMKTDSGTTNRKQEGEKNWVKIKEHEIYLSRKQNTDKEGGVDRIMTFSE